MEILGEGRRFLFFIFISQRGFEVGINTIDAFLSRYAVFLCHGVTEEVSSECLHCLKDPSGVVSGPGCRRTSEMMTPVIS